MKKILFITYNFAPRQSVGSIRPTRLAMYLAKMGHKVDVVCAKEYGMLDHSMDEVFDYIGTVEKITHPQMNEKNIPLNTPQKQPTSKQASKIKKLPLADRVKKSLFEVKKIKMAKEFADKFEDIVKNDIDRFSEYDTVITTYGPLESTYCSFVMKKYFPNVRLVSDFRDPMTFADYGYPANLIRARVQKKVCEISDALVSISKGTFDEIFTKEAYRKKAKVIYNGYDISDIPKNKNNYDGQYSFLCLGTMYHGKRDVSVLFKALSELCKEGNIDEKDIKVNYVGGHFDILKSQAERYSLENVLSNRGFVTRSECMAMQTESRNLLLPNWNFHNAKGVLTGKFFEYMVTGRPIISIVCGDTPDSEISELIERYGFGFSYEQANDKEDYEKLKQYLLNDYKRYKQGLDCEIIPSDDAVSDFNYEKITKQFEKLV